MRSVYGLAIFTCAGTSWSRLPCTDTLYLAGISCFRLPYTDTLHLVISPPRSSLSSTNHHLIKALPRLMKSHDAGRMDEDPSMHTSTIPGRLRPQREDGVSIGRNAPDNTNQPPSNQPPQSLNSSGEMIGNDPSSSSPGQITLPPIHTVLLREDFNPPYSPPPSAFLPGHQQQNIDETKPEKKSKDKIHCSFAGFEGCNNNAGQGYVSRQGIEGHVIRHHPGGKLCVNVVLSGCRGNGSSDCSCSRLQQG